MNKINFRKAKAKDIPFLVILNSELDNSLRAPFRKIKTNSNKIVETFFLKAINNKKQIIFLAELKKEIIGFVLINIRSAPQIFQNKFEAVITDLFVKKEFRKKGIAKNLIKKAKAFAKKNKCPYVRLNVYYSNKIAKKVYEKLDFKKFAIIYAGEV